MKDWPIEERYKKIDDPNNLTKLYEEVKNSKYKQKIHISPLTGLLNDQMDLPTITVCSIYFISGFHGDLFMELSIGIMLYRMI